MIIIHNDQLNNQLQSVHKRNSKQQSVRKIIQLIKDAKNKSSNTYTVPLEEVLGLSNTDQQLNNANPSSRALQTMFLNVTHDIEKILPIKWTNEVYSKFLSINIDSAAVLLHHITNKTSNQELKRNKLFMMNNTKIQALASVSAEYQMNRII